MRVGIIALQHESNTFASTRTTLDRFQHDHLLVGPAVRRHMAGTHHEVAGFFAGLDRLAIEAVPVFSARALPGGTITESCFNHLLHTMLEALNDAGPLDGLLLAPHGAAVSEQHGSADGFWMQCLRERVGPTVPAVATIDIHANVSPAMVASADAVIAYRTNPHMDQFDRGLEAAELLGRILRERTRPQLAMCRPPMVINIERQSTAEPPCAALLQAADQWRREPGVLAASIVLGFPYADVPDMGPCALVTTDAGRDPQPLADQLGRSLWRSRRDLAGRLVDIDDALALAANQPGPVLLLDMGDNVGGGSPGDSTCILHAFRRHAAGGALVTLYDPPSVDRARAAGAGGQTTLRMGGKGDPACGGPFEAAVRVLALFDGKFRESQPRHGGMSEFDMGPTAVVRTDDGHTIMLTSQRLFPVSIGQWTAFGINPRAFRFIVAKGVHAPVAAYRDVCPAMIRVNTPGVTSADLLAFEYRHRPRPMYPFEPDTAWDT